MRYLMDTGIASDYFNRRHGVFEKAREAVSHGHRVGTAVPVLAELVAGIEHSQTRERNLQRLQAGLPTIRLWPFDQSAAFEYGRIFAELSRRGRPMQVVDMMIAAVANTLGGCTIVSVDSDLLAIPHLRVENWRI